MAEYKCTRVASENEIEHAYYPDWVYNDKGDIVPSRLNQYIAQQEMKKGNANKAGYYNILSEAQTLGDKLYGGKKVTTNKDVDPDGWAYTLVKNSPSSQVDTQFVANSLADRQREIDATASKEKESYNKKSLLGKAAYKGKQAWSDLKRLAQYIKRKITKNPNA